MGQLQETYLKYACDDGGGDKGSLHSYIDIYAKQMRRKKNIDLLEVGVWRGYSLAMWQDYFTDSRIVGVDIDLSRCELDVDARRCDATNPGELQMALGDMRFDYIIDDGSHRLEDQVASFGVLWDRLKPAGKYFVEDIQNDYALAVLIDTIKAAGAEPIIYDLRAHKGRYDDILLMVVK
jgi:hypothetical protein